MKGAVKVSVIIPAYNALPYLPQTVESVFTQTFEDFELLIVNDGSTDGLAQWASTLTDERVKVIHQSNQGPGAARNEGLRQSQGEFIAFLDADDLWLPTKLAKQVAELEAHPEVGLTHTSISYIDERGDKLYKDLPAHGRGNVWRHIVAFNPRYLIHCGSTPLIRRECFDSVGMFSTELRLAQDWEMWIRISRHYHLSALDEVLVRYRQHPTNISKSYTLALKTFSTIIESTFQTVEPELAHLKWEAYGRTHMLVAWRAYWAGDEHLAYEFHQQALKFFPRLSLVRNSLHLSSRLLVGKLRRLRY